MIQTQETFTPARRNKRQKLSVQGGWRWVHPVDCKEVMKSMGENSVSLVLTDPPYFIDGMGDEWDHGNLESRVRRNGVVGSLPVGMKYDRSQGYRLQEFIRPIAEQWMRIVRPGGFILCFSQNRLVHRMASAIEDAGFEIRDVLAWRYEGQAKAFTQEHFVRRRNISELEKQRLIRKLGGRKTPQLKPQCELIVLAQAPRDGTFVDNWDKWETGLIDPSNPVVESSRFPGTVIPVPKPRERHGHMTAKPVELLRHLIRVFSAEGAMVFDPFAGSGSTGVAACIESRDFVGCEIDKRMAASAEQNE